MKNLREGVFITFEGGEGCGKTTQVNLLVERLEALGFQVVLVHEPGGTRLGERIRSLLLDKGEEDIDPMAELLLYEASRAQIMEKVICPALQKGKVIICDRFTDSTVAYQGVARGLGADLVAKLNLLTTNGTMPHRTILLDMDPSQGLARAKSVTGGDGEGDRIESAGLDFHSSVRYGFAQLAQSEPDRIRLIDAGNTIERVQEDIWNNLADLFEEAQ